MILALVGSVSLSAVLALGHPVDSRPDTTTYRVLMQGNEAGELLVWSEGDVVHHRFAFNDRGRGPDLHTRVQVAPSGVPVRIEIDGVDYLKNEVAEEFTLRDGVARWRNRGERDSARVKGPALYVPLNSPPSLAATAVAALGELGRSCVALLPAGELCVAPADTAVVEVEGVEREVVLHALTGMNFTPQYVWLEPDGTYFGTTGGWLAVVPEGWEGAADELAGLESDAREAWLARIAERVPETPSGPVAIVGARLFDPVTGTLQSGTTVVFDGDRITAVGSDDAVSIPSDARRVNAGDRTLLPGLFDMHVHLGPVEGMLHLAAGVTSVRDLANDVDQVQRLREAFGSGELVGPRVTLGGFLDGPGPFAGPTKALVATVEEARQWIDRYAGLGYDQIKVYSSIDTAIVPAIVRMAHERGMRVSGHIPVHLTAEEAVEIGFDEIQHVNMLFLNFRSDTLDTRTPVRFTEVGLHGGDLDPMSDSVQAFIRLLRENDVVVDPTVAIFENMFTARPGVVSPTFAAIADRLPPQVQRGFLTGGRPTGEEERARYRHAFRRMLDLVAALHEGGVRIVAGTDAMAGFTLHRELELYQEAGLAGADVLRIATLEAARVAGRADELGTIEPGKLADMVLVEGDPTEDVSAVRNTVLVIKDGILYDPAELYRAVGVQPASRSDG